MRFPWTRRSLDEEARALRGKLAEEVVKNDRARVRISESHARPVGDFLEDLFRQLDEANRRG